jgi:XisI protein
VDRLQQYRDIVRQILTEQAQPYNHSNDLDAEVIFDTEHDRYQLIYIVMHFDIKDGKIWIQYNGTELAIAQILVDRGIPASDIVLGFHSAFKRQFSGYSIA